MQLKMLGYVLFFSFFKGVEIVENYYFITQDNVEMLKLTKEADFIVVSMLKKYDSLTNLVCRKGIGLWCYLVFKMLFSIPFIFSLRYPRIQIEIWVCHRVEYLIC